jgi:hypothetical protein
MYICIYICIHMYVYTDVKCIGTQKEFRAAAVKLDTKELITGARIGFIQSTDKKDIELGENEDYSSPLHLKERGRGENNDISLRKATYVSICIYIYSYTYICTYTYVYVHIYMFIYICMNTYVPIYHFRERICYTCRLR